MVAKFGGLQSDGGIHGTAKTGSGANQNQHTEIAKNRNIQLFVAKRLCSAVSEANSVSKGSRMSMANRDHSFKMKTRVRSVPITISLHDLIVRYAAIG